MQTVHLDIQDEQLETFLTIIHNLKGGIIERIRFGKDEMVFEEIEKDTEDFNDITATKNENNTKYSMDEARAKLGL